MNGCLPEELQRLQNLFRDNVEEARLVCSLFQQGYLTVAVETA